MTTLNEATQEITAQQLVEDNNLKINLDDMQYIISGNEPKDTYIKKHPTIKNVYHYTREHSYFLDLDEESEELYNEHKNELWNYLKDILGPDEEKYKNMAVNDIMECCANGVEYENKNVENLLYAFKKNGGDGAYGYYTITYEALICLY